MASPFDACLRATNRVFDRVAGEDFVLELQAQEPTSSGRANVNARPVPVPGAKPIPFRGIWFDKGAILHAQGRSMADSTTRPVAAETPIIDYAVEDLAERAPVNAVIRRPKTGTAYTVARDMEADLGRRRILLTELRDA